MKKILSNSLIFIIVISLWSTMGLSGCSKNETLSSSSNIGGSNTSSSKSFKKGSSHGVFLANYKVHEFDIKPEVPMIAIKKDFLNINQNERYELSKTLRNEIVKNGFAINRPNFGVSTFAKLYEMNRYGQMPNFITTDSILHTYHLVFDELLKDIEKKYLINELKEMNKELLKEANVQYEALKDTEYKNVALRNVAFLSVGSILVGQDVVMDEEVKALVNQELQLIENHSGINISPIMNLGNKKENPAMEDYSQYIPRGHYTKSKELKQYFKAMMWYGRQTFRFDNESELQSALLLSTLFSKYKSGALSSWSKIYEPTNFLVGNSDSISPKETANIVYEVYESDNTPQSIAQLKAIELLENKEKVEAFKKICKENNQSKINSVPVFDASIQPDIEKVTAGFRLMGQRYVLDGEIFHKLIYRRVLENTKGDRRMMPETLDIMAAMGSKEAEEKLKEKKTFDYKNYKKNLEELKEQMDQMTLSDWNQNVYSSWLYTLKPLTKSVPTGYPDFMKNPSWQWKKLNTYLGSYAELKHDTILYALQPMAEMGGGGDIKEMDHRGYVEPELEIYGRLNSMIVMTSKGLQEMGLLSEKFQSVLENLEEMSDTLMKISEKELRNEKLTEEDYQFIDEYGGYLEHIQYEIKEDDDNPIIADISSSPDAVLEIGTGYVDEIYVVVPIDGVLQLTKGGIYSTYEFIVPPNNRLDDDTWNSYLNYKRDTQFFPKPNYPIEYIKHNHWMTPYILKGQDFNAKLQLEDGSWI